MARLNIAVNQEDDPLGFGPIYFTTSGNNFILSSQTGNQIEIYKLFLEVQGATVLTFYGGTTPLSGPLPMRAHSFLDLDFDTKPWFEIAIGSNFIINSSNAVVVAGYIAYTDGSPDIELREDLSFELREDTYLEIRDGP